MEIAYKHDRENIAKWILLGSCYLFFSSNACGLITHIRVVMKNTVILLLVAKTQRFRLASAYRFLYLFKERDYEYSQYDEKLDRLETIVESP